MRLEVFDPPMCCATGVCGTEVDPVLPRFAAALEWLKTQGVSVTRYNLAQEPAEFVNQAAVCAALHETGNDCLPMILLEGQVMSRGTYPERSTLASWLGLTAVPEKAADSPKRTLHVLTTPTRCC